MAKQFISDPNTIILAIIQANVDIDNSKALNLAKTVDPEGQRTLGVVTKADLVQEEPEKEVLLEILTNRKIHLKKGYIAVKNRSQAEIESGLTPDDNLAKEEEFFSKPEFAVLGNRVGSRYLLRELARILAQKIKERLPDFGTELSQKIAEINAELGQPGFKRETEISDRALLLQLTTSFWTEVEKSVYGLSQSVSSKERMCGATVNKALQEGMEVMIEQARLARSNQQEEEAQIIIENQHGINNPLFPPEQAMYQLVRHLIEHYREPFKALLCSIRQIFISYIKKAAEKYLEAFPNLHERVAKIMTHKIEDQCRTTEDMIDLILNAEQSFINTKHPDFWEHAIYIEGRSTSGPIPEVVPGQGAAGPPGNLAVGNTHSGRVKAFQQELNKFGTAPEGEEQREKSMVIPQATSKQAGFLLDLVEV